MSKACLDKYTTVNKINHKSYLQKKFHNIFVINFENVIFYEQSPHVYFEKFSL